MGSMDESIETQAPAEIRQVIGRDDKGRDVVMYAQRACRVLSNGALQDVETGKMVRPAPNSFDAIKPYTVRTTEQAQSLLHTRWHGSRQEALRGAVERATGSAMPTIEHADAAVIADMVEGVVLNVDVRADHRVKAAKWVYEQAGMDGKAPRQSNSDVTPAQAAQIGATAAVLAMALDELRRRQAIG